MPAETKVCNLTEEEVTELIEYHGRNVATDFSERIDRLDYLHKRLNISVKQMAADLKALTSRVAKLEKVLG